MACDYRGFKIGVVACDYRGFKIGLKARDKKLYVARDMMKTFLFYILLLTTVTSLYR